MRLVLAAGRSGPAMAKPVQVAAALAGIPPDAMLPDSAVLDLVVADRAVLPLDIPPQPANMRSLYACGPAGSGLRDRMDACS